jgi:hypothetical protein
MAMVTLRVMTTMATAIKTAIINNCLFCDSDGTIAAIVNISFYI